MAVCAWCQREMTAADSCATVVLHMHGVEIAKIPFGSVRGRRRVRGRCGDCGVAPGGLHHLGCDLERCPVCRRQLISCDCAFDELGGVDDREDELDEPADFWLDGNGALTERKWIGGQEVIVHYADMPEKDVTTVDGIRCTTPLRTAIDLASELEPAELEGVVDDFLARGLFTLDEAAARTAEPDMLGHRGARILRHHLAL